MMKAEMIEEMATARKEMMMQGKNEISRSMSLLLDDIQRLVVAMER